jgi:hypothetical protein
LRFIFALAGTDMKEQTVPSFGKTIWKKLEISWRIQILSVFLNISLSSGKLQLFRSWTAFEPVCSASFSNSTQDNCFKVPLNPRKNTKMLQFVHLKRQRQGVRQWSRWNVNSVPTSEGKCFVSTHTLQFLYSWRQPLWRLQNGFPKTPHTRSFTRSLNQTCTSVDTTEKLWKYRSRRRFAHRSRCGEWRTTGRWTRSMKVLSEPRSFWR